MNAHTLFASHSAPSRLAASLAAAAATLALASPALAQEEPASPWTVAAHVNVLWHLDAGYDTFATNTAVNPAVTLMVGRDLLRTGPLSLGVEAGWSIETGTGRYADLFDTTLSSNTFHGGVYARYALFRWLQPYARASAGGAYHQARFSPDNGNADLIADTWSFVGTVGAGLQVVTGTLFPSATSTFRVMAGLEGGFQYGTGAELSTSPEPPSNEAAAADRLSVRAVNLGTLSPSAPYLRVTVGFRF